MLWKRFVQIWQSHRLYILLALAIALFIAVSLLVPDPTGYGPQTRPSATPSPTSQSGRLFQIALSWFEQGDCDGTVAAAPPRCTVRPSSVSRVNPNPIAAC